MTIKRSSPDVGYIDPALFAQMGMSQTVRAKDTVYFSGLVAATGAFQAVSPGDAKGQVKFVLDVLGKLLAKEGMSYANLVSVTVYSPDTDKIFPEMGQLAERFAAHPPCLTVIGVKNLGIPDNLLEVTAVAVA